MKRLGAALIVIAACGFALVSVNGQGAGHRTGSRRA